MKSIVPFIVAITIIATSISACKKDEPTAPTPLSAEEQAHVDDSLILTYLKTNSISAEKTSDGLYYSIIEAGNEIKPNTSSTVTIKYKGYLLNGSVFDETKANSAQFPLERLIMGWQLGLPLIGEGGTINLFIPSTLGYGPYAIGSIPANSVIIFEIDLIAVSN